jgi:hypothetical protein
MSLSLDIAKLRKACDAVCGHLADLGYGNVVLPQGEYWQLSLDQTYSVPTPPGDPAIGSLYDDWEDLERLVESPEDALVTDCRPLAALIHALMQVVRERPGTAG